MIKIKFTPIYTNITEPPLDAYRLLVRSEHVNLPPGQRISEVMYKLIKFVTIISRNMMVWNWSNVHYEGKGVLSVVSKIVRLRSIAIEPKQSALSVLQK